MKLHSLPKLLHWKIFLNKYYAKLNMQQKESLNVQSESFANLGFSFQIIYRKILNGRFNIKNNKNGFFLNFTFTKVRKKCSLVLFAQSGRSLE